MASSPDMPSFPAMPAAYSAFSASDSPENASRISVNCCLNGFMLPSPSTSDIDKASIYPRICFVGFARFVSMVRIAVPAFCPLIPAFAINPVATATSSMVYPNAPATGATYWNVSPIIATLVFELEDACARTSAKCPASLACIPNAVMASVTMSDTIPNSSPEAAAKYMMPGSPPIMSPVFQPAIAMYSSPFPASSAENFVVSPISFAKAVSFSMSPAELCEIACTVLICDSNPIPTAVEAPRMAAVPAAASFAPFTIPPKTLSDALPSASIPFTLIPPKESPIFRPDKPACLSSPFNSLLAFRIDAASEASVPPDIIISSS